MARLPRLTRLQHDFVHAFVAHDDPHIRYNATAAYIAVSGACTRPEVAKAAASRVLTKPHVLAAITVLQAQTDAAVFTRLVDWKTAAAEAQPYLLNLVRGVLPDGRRMIDRDTAAVGQVVLGALKEIMDRGFPKKLCLHIDPREALAKLLGVPRESLPEHWDEEEL
jgi:hypothetical protein